MLHNNLMVDPDALAAIQAWTRLDAALGAFNRRLEREHGVTGAQLAILRIIREWSAAGADGVPLSTMRERLVMHAATLGQLLDRLAGRGLVDVSPDPVDRRRRLVRLTPEGERLVADAPLAGPVRLRYQPADPTTLRRLAQAFDDAIVLFGLEDTPMASELESLVNIGPKLAADLRQVGVPDTETLRWIERK